MRQFVSIGKEPNLQRLVVISALLHLIIIVFVSVPQKTGQREFKSYYVDLVSPPEVRKDDRVGVKKDELRDDQVITGKGTEKVIPEKHLPPVKEPLEKKKAVPEKTIKTEPRPDSEMALKKTEDVIAREIERLSAIKALSRQKKEDEKKRQEIEIIRNRVHEGPSGAGGIPGERGGVGSDPYYAIISEMIWSQWVYPALESSGLEVIVFIKIDRKGNIVSQEIEKTSGNTLFDQSALRAISKANPLPPPPIGTETEIGVRFYL